jgi:hypothetical protein
MCRTVLWSIILAVCAKPGLALAQGETGPVAITVHAKDTGKPLSCRIHLKDTAGKPQRAPKLPFWNDHFACPGTVRLDLAPGRYTIDIERGPEYLLARGSFTVRDKTGANLTFTLERLADLTAEG